MCKALERECDMRADAFSCSACALPVDQQDAL
jgi:hypothetical protein